MILVQPSLSLPSVLSVGGEVAAVTSPSDEQQVADLPTSAGEVATTTVTSPPSVVPSQGTRRPSSGARELRRARIVVTVRRTESYKRWLEENPLHAIIASETDEDAVGDMETTSDAAVDDPE
jgi:hypothetical protein